MEETGKVNGGVSVEITEKETLCGALFRMGTMIIFPDQTASSASASLLHRIKASVSENGPRVREASRNTGRDIIRWTRRGSPLRALLVISGGTISLLALTGLAVFMLLFIALTVNAIVISLLMSLAAAGGFLALFFTCLTGIYVAALSIAAFAIFTATLSAIFAVLVAAGWIGFFCISWLATKKSMAFAKHSLSVTALTLSAYSGRQY